MVVAVHRGHQFLGLIGADPHIAVIHDDAPVSERSERTLCCGITQFVVVDGRIDKIVGVAASAQGGCLKECVALKGGPGRMAGVRYNARRFFDDSQHIRRKDRDAGAFGGSILCGAETGVEINGVVLSIYGGVKLRLVSGAFAQNGPVGVFDKAVKFIFSGRRIADSYRYDMREIGNIIHIVASVRSLHYVGGKKRHLPVRIAGVLFFAVSDAFIAPVA